VRGGVVDRYEVVVEYGGKCAWSLIYVEFVGYVGGSAGNCVRAFAA
jgi:hypothetical protein